MKKVIGVVCCFAMAMAVNTASAQQLAIGESIGIDFGTTGTVFGTDSGVPPTAGTNFNEFNLQTADGTTETLPAVMMLSGNPSTIDFSVTNNAGKDSGLTGIAGSAGPAPFDDPTIGVDNYGAANVGNLDRADGGPLAEDGNFVLTFSGLDDTLAYEVTGGYLHDGPNDNFNTIWEIDGQIAETANESGMPDAGYMTLSGLCTDGSGNLEITVTRTVQLFMAGVTITATGPAGPKVILGDINLDMSVDFSDIAPFIALLAGQMFQEEGDIDGNEIVDFRDIAPFIGLLSGGGGTAPGP